MRKFLLLTALFFSFAAQAQFGATHGTGVRSNGLANASVAFTDLNSIFNNQAGLANLKETGFLLAAEQRFLLADLSSFGAGFAQPTRSGTFGLSVHYFGFESYNESKIGLAYGRKLMEKLSVGVQFDVLNTRISEYGSKTLFTFEVGLQAELIENLLVGIHIYNPVRLEIIEDEFLPSVFRAGATYTASKKLMLHTELEKDFDFPFVFKAGIEYALAKELWLRLGVQTNPTALSFGLGYQFQKGLRIDFATNYHQDLGFTPSLGVGFELNKKGKKKKRK